MKISNDEKMLSLHRYFIWMDLMKSHFDSTLKLSEAENNPNEYKDTAVLARNQFVYLSLWYAGLHTVIEGWNRLKLSDYRIDLLMRDGDNRRLLKRFRHGVDHFQIQYFDNKLMGLLEEGEKTDFVPWVRRLHRELGQYFLNWFNLKRLVFLLSDVLKIV